VDQGQSFEGHRKRMSTRKTGHPVYHAITTRKCGFCIHLYSKTILCVTVTLNISTFIVDPDSIIVKDVDLPDLEKIRQSIMHVNVLVVRVCQL